MVASKSLQLARSEETCCDVFVLSLADQSSCRNVYACPHHAPTLPGRGTLCHLLTYIPMTMRPPWPRASAAAFLAPNHCHWMVLEAPRLPGIKGDGNWTPVWSEFSTGYGLHCGGSAMPNVTAPGLVQGSLQRASGLCVLVLAEHGCPPTAKARRTDGAQQMRFGKA